MKIGVFIFVFGLLQYIQSVTTGLETVWLKDVTKIFRSDKRKLSDPDLPDQLIFHLKRGADVLALNLKRNYDIDPNADIYVVQNMTDGRSLLTKAEILEKEDLAYYQDIENGAFMTVRCVKRSNGQCERLINGNIRIGRTNYDVEPEEAETDITSRKVLEVQSRFGKRYVLRDQANIQRVHSVENIEHENRALLRRFLHGQDKKSHISRSDPTLSSQTVTGLHTRGRTDYYIEVAVLIDSTILDIYSSLIRTDDSSAVQRKIREAYSHIINGVNLLYKELGDSSFTISIILVDFIFFKAGQFRHNHSGITIVDGKTYIEARKYFDDLNDWDKTMGANSLPNYDHAMLFTRHVLYEGSTRNTGINGISTQSGVCLLGYRNSVIMARGYSATVLTAAHELGHNLGAPHDGEKGAKDCKADDLFIMSPKAMPVNRTLPYSRNPWLFSNCSVRAFKKVLKDKDCVTDKGAIYNADEWTMYMKEQAGDVFTPDVQCHLTRGPKSVYCGRDISEICNLLRCTVPQTGKCRGKYYSAARGTKCGDMKWCIEGRCVPQS